MHNFAIVLVDADVFDPVQQAWKLLAPFQVREEESVCPCDTFAEPSPCDLCEGTGVIRYDSNPVSRFDWMMIGGRFDGFVTGHPPTNFERLWELAGSYSKPPVKLANGRVRVEFADEFRERFDDECERMALANVAPVSDLPDDLNCVAVVTPDGLLFMAAMRGYETSPVAKEHWKREVKDLLEAHSDCLAVKVDLHV